jgi:VanZ family protein
VRRRSSAVPLAWLYAALIVYASLYPFDGWRAARAPVLDFLWLPWPRWWTGFDLAFNLLGYTPLGLLVAWASMRLGVRKLRPWWIAVGLAAVLSLTMEVLQNFLPPRVPSNVDWALNVAGAALGAALGGLVQRTGGVARWQSLREKWLVERSTWGLALLLLWPVGLLFPAPVALGMGQGFWRLKDQLAAWTDQTFAHDWLHNWLQPQVQLTPMAPGTELATVVLGLLAPCVLGFTFVRPGWRRLLLVLVVATVGFGATTLSTALNFGPQHALAWFTPSVLLAIGWGVLIAALLSRLPWRASAAIGLVVITTLVGLVANAPTDPYYAESLQAWEQGRFIRFHGAAQWVGWLWPLATLLYLLARVSAVHDSAAQSSQFAD